MKPVKRVAVVTGGGKGIGSAIARALAEDGVSLVLAGRDVEALNRHRHALQGVVGAEGVMAVSCDVTSTSDIENLIERTIDGFGRLDILVNAAGVPGPLATPAQDLALEDFEQVFRVNVFGTFLCCKYAIPHLVLSSAGRIINVGSTSGMRGEPDRVAYVASKWAVRGITRTLARELGEYDVTVNTLCPNWTHGDRMERMLRGEAARAARTRDEIYNELAAETALRRFIDERDSAEIVRFLVSDGARNVTGQEFVVDAGMLV